MIKTKIKKLLEEIEGKQSLSDKFHSLSNNKGLSDLSVEDIPQSWVKIHFKTYPRLNKIKLTNLDISTSKTSEIITKRRSIREFSGLPLSKKELFHLLFFSCGLTKSSRLIDESKRPYPSAGARYPLEVYPIILNCKGIKKGLYHYNIKENLLELLLDENLDDWLTKTTGGEKWIKKSAVIFVITGVLDRTRIKYGDRSYRYTLIETGHLSQNICLLATELGLATCPMGGYVDEEVNKLLDINLQKEVALYLIALGKI